ncbi:MAG: MFS transporter [Spirochaetes bacterium]|nr:MFS transporter [Spirochaetota bacterium]
MKIYLCPALLDLVVFLVTFAVLYAAGERGLSLRECMWLGVIFQVAYFSFSLLSGLFLTRRNARGVLLASTVGAGVFGIASLLFTDFALIAAALFLFGTGCALFFNSFQTFMRGEAPPGGLARSVGLYTLAWSAGSSLGFLSSGAFYRFGMWAMAGLTFAVGVLLFAILVRHRPRPESSPSSDEQVEEGSGEAARRVDPAYVLAGWLLIFTTMFVQRPVFTYFPSLAAKAGIGSLTASLPLFFHMMAQALFGWFLIRHRDLLYRRTPMFAFQAAAVLLFLVIWRSNAFWVSTLSVSLLGLVTGYNYFCAVYYSSNSGKRSFNIGVNEFLVGLGSLAGLIACEYGMARLGGKAASMYLVCAWALGAAAILQLIVVTGRRRKIA